MHLVRTVFPLQFLRAWVTSQTPTRLALFAPGPELRRARLFRRRRRGSGWYCALRFPPHGLRRQWRPASGTRHRGTSQARPAAVQGPKLSGAAGRTRDTRSPNYRISQSEDVPRMHAGLRGRDHASSLSRNRASAAARLGYVVRVPAEDEARSGNSKPNPVLIHHGRPRSSQVKLAACIPAAADHRRSFWLPGRSWSLGVFAVARTPKTPLRPRIALPSSFGLRLLPSVAARKSRASQRLGQMAGVNVRPRSLRKGFTSIVRSTFFDSNGHRVAFRVDVPLLRLEDTRIDRLHF
jgi:hypothetical protein